MINITLSETINAAPPQVLTTLLDHQRLDRFFDAKFSINQPQNPGELDGGAGCIRQVSMIGLRFNEQIISADAQHICYEILGPGPVSEHQGNIYLSATSAQATKTRVQYQIRCQGPKWIPNALLEFVLRQGVKKALCKLSQYYQ